MAYGMQGYNKSTYKAQKDPSRDNSLLAVW